MSVRATPVGIAAGIAPRIALAAAGVAALAARPVGAPAAWIALAVGAAALAWPVVAGPVRPLPWATATIVGSAAFVAVRFSMPGLRLAGGDATVAIAVVVAVAEEAFFRRFLYDLAARRGAAMAVAVPAVLFALIHVPLYGAWVLPLDLAAGLLLGWQRWVAGHWSSPAATHALANLLAYWR
ncbi:MAG TPA: CPBP family glutamic-type intramembrane protease [Actinomycetota bacterium]